MRCRQCGFDDFRPARRLPERLATAVLPVQPLVCTVCGARVALFDSRITVTRIVAWGLSALLAAYGVHTYGQRKVNRINLVPPTTTSEAETSNLGTSAKSATPPSQIVSDAGTESGATQAQPPTQLAVGGPSPGLEPQVQTELDPMVSEQAPVSGDVLHVSSRRRSDCLVIEVETGMPTVATKSFGLSDPPRWVVDIAGAWSVPESTHQTPASLYVRQVRLGRHESHTRVVIDLELETPRPTIEAVETGLEVVVCPSS